MKFNAGPEKMRAANDSDSEFNWEDGRRNDGVSGEMFLWRAVLYQAWTDETMTAKGYSTANVLSLKSETEADRITREQRQARQFLLGLGKWREQLEYVALNAGAVPEDVTRAARREFARLGIEHPKAPLYVATIQDINETVARRQAIAADTARKERQAQRERAREYAAKVAADKERHRQERAAKIASGAIRVSRAKLTDYQRDRLAVERRQTVLYWHAQGDGMKDIASAYGIPYSTVAGIIASNPEARERQRERTLAAKRESARLAHAANRAKGLQLTAE